MIITNKLMNMHEILILSEREKKEQLACILKEYKFLIVPKILSKREFEVIELILDNKKLSKVYTNYLNASIKYKLAASFLLAKIGLNDLIFKKGINFFIEEKTGEIFQNNVLPIKSERIKAIKEVFDFLKKIDFIKYYFIVGSYLTKEKFEDIDICLFIEDKTIEEDPRALIAFISSYLKDKFGHNFHINVFDAKELYETDKNLLLFSLLSQSIGNRKIELKPEMEKIEFPINNSIFIYSYMDIDKEEYSVYLGDLRSVAAYKLFLEGKELNSVNIENELIKDYKAIFLKLKNNQALGKQDIKWIRAKFLENYKLIFSLFYRKTKNNKLLDYIKENISEFEDIYKQNRDKNSYANWILYKEVLKEIEKD